ncbi:Translation Initiation factor eIF- 4e-like domain [Pseudocohnilembus persalinus]|uniref:Translation Initiation factor eIF-4e-like domain n=1 Tax=Pseudocohnilembus persalinus TaxID=266149 RepID=A0A0V0R2H6_PSEPJ|nr:Translation Initiation factor eIF- 4e-like domain [Pseudocohnilembus persalinus]|eukprot:KRX08538.1 Translation Initiation factor eIF- 4e-like domain [Pseudocohnilembus persalinus]
MDTKQKEHKLRRKFTFYYQQISDDQTDDQWNIKKIDEFDTVEKFWKIFQHIKRPSQIETNAQIFLFAENSIPKWEDPSHKNGGRFKKGIAKIDVDQSWENFALSFISGQKELLDKVNGIQIKIMQNREKCMGCVWVQDINNVENAENDLKQWLFKCTNSKRQSTDVTFEKF